MFKNLLKLSFITILIAGAPTFALSPDAIFEDGEKAFNLAKYEDSREFFQRFLETWPEHKKHTEALYYFTMASVKTIDSRTESYRQSLGEELRESIASLSKDLTEDYLKEANAALMIAQDPNKPELWNHLEKLAPDELYHYLARQWHPAPDADPFATIKWAQTWLKNNKSIDCELKSDIDILQLYALWEIIRSPLVLENNSDKFKEIDCQSPHKLFGKLLNEAFKNGNPDQKRIVAVFGYHFDYFTANKLNTNKKVNSSWMRYLKSRGLSPQDTWSPKWHRN